MLWFGFPLVSPQAHDRPTIIARSPTGNQHPRFNSILHLLFPECLPSAAGPQNPCRGPLLDFGPRNTSTQRFFCFLADTVKDARMRDLSLKLTLLLLLSPRVNTPSLFDMACRNRDRNRGRSRIVKVGVNPRPPKQASKQASGRQKA